MPKAVAIYLRLSQEDIDVRRNAARDESNSISAQRSLIVQHLDQTPDLAELPRLEFCDDGFSGANFDRPEFQRMIELVKAGEISCIVVKDLSRFGRDYLEVGDYLEHIFPFLGIRFKSINDHYDSRNHDGKTVGMDIAFRNLVYDYYSKDLSSKVKTAMRCRQEKGEFITCFTYGYKPSPENKHRMVIDEPAAEIVREIFNAVLAGRSTSEIAADLNARGVPTPKEYKGVRRKEKTEPQWTHPRIACMIRNIKYAGVMANHTRESRHIRDKNQRRVPVEKWILHPDAHEAIIPREKWDRANEMLRSPRKVRRSVLDQPDRVYYCVHCGRKLRKTYGADQYYTCISAKYQREGECASIRLKRSEMEEILVSALRTQLSLVKVSKEETRNQQRSASEACCNAIGRMEKELARVQQKKLERYEAYRSGEISREDFICIKEHLALKAEELAAQKAHHEQAYQALLNAQQQQAERTAGFTQAEKALAGFDAGLREHLYEAIERVLVTSNEEIEIEWVFADAFTQ
ncbi:MAG: recombinase family protein [Candidatus Faecivicinus sp.]